MVMAGNRIKVCFLDRTTMIFAALVLLFLVPGSILAAIVFRRALPEFIWLSLSFSFGIFWTTIGTLILSFLHIPLSIPVLVIYSFSPIFFLIIDKVRREYFGSMKKIQWRIPNIILIAVILSFLLIPFISIHNQLPTGDVQKSIYWAKDVINNHSLPNYSKSEDLNRDPTDFSTPALHTLTAAVISFTKDQYKSVAWFSFVTAIALAGLASSIIFKITSSNRASLLVFVFAAMNLRFLRYVYTPGYHFQNLIGEIFFSLAFLIFLECLPTKENDRKISIWIKILLLTLIVIVIPLVHQFTAFLTAFILLAMAILFLVINRHNIYRTIIGNKFLFFVLSVLAILGLFAVITLFPVKEKIFNIFNNSPHMKAFLIPPYEYPELLGATLAFFGLAGLIVSLFKHFKNRIMVGFLGVWVVTVFILGQGPLFYVDIPSARALFFSAIPLSVFAGLVLFWALEYLEKFKKISFHFLIVVSVILATLFNVSSAQLAIADHGQRINATLTKDSIDLINYLKTRQNEIKGNLLIDDWNQRRLTWTILSPLNMVTRIGGDLKVIGDESKQSSVRKKLYDNNLNFEKIFMLGNSPLIESLLIQHNIKFIAAANGITDDVFIHNPLLKLVYKNKESSLFEITNKVVAIQNQDDSFILKNSTLANEVGDKEDILPHSAISLASTDISDPMEMDRKTVRSINKDFTLRLNVGTYVNPYWNSGKNQVDLPIKIYINVKNNGTGGRLFYENKELNAFKLPTNNSFSNLVFNVPPRTFKIDEKGFIDLKIKIDHNPLIMDFVAAGIIP